MGKLCAYVYEGTPINEMNNFSRSWLQGNAPYIEIGDGDDVHVNYIEITSIENWQKYGSGLGKRPDQLRKILVDLYDSMTTGGGDWDELNANEKKILAKHFIVEKVHRDEVLTEQEQDLNNHFKIYHFLNRDAYKRLGIYSLNDMSVTPKSLDYKKDVSQRLHPEYDFDDAGFLVRVTYYENLDINVVNGIAIQTFTNPIVKYEAQYFSNADNYVTHRIVTRSWQLMDDTWSDDTKTSIKYYNSKTAREEGNKRRHNLINNLLIDVVGLIFMTTSALTTISDTEADAIAFLQEIETGISLYYESGAKEDAEGNPCLLMQQVNASTYDKLDNFVPNTGNTVTIRMFILSRLNPTI